MADVQSRYRETHDFTHTLAGVGVSVEEELGVKMFELAQTGLPVAAIRLGGGGGGGGCCAGGVA